MNPKGTFGSRVSLLSPITAALAAAGLISTAQAQVQVAGTLLINVDATAAPLGPITSIANAGTLGGVFEARGGGANNPTVAQVSGNGTRGIRFDGSDFLQHVASVGGALVPADATLVGPNPTCSIEAWVLNPDISGEETIVSWGRRGGNPDGSNMSFNYGWDDRWGAVGHWGAPDIGWDPCCNGGTDPLGVPTSGQWHLLVYTYDGSTTRVYADGVLKNSETLGLNTAAGNAVMIGSQYSEVDGVTPLAVLRGSMTIARLRIHSEALSDAQVANNYNFERNNFSVGGSALPFGPIHRYSFLNPAGPGPSGSVISDSVGTSHGVVRGNGANFTGNRLTLPGGSSLSQAYVDLPNRLLSVNSSDTGGSGQITLEGWVKITAGRAWGRIFDFGNGTGGEITGPGGSAEGRDYIFFSGSNGTNPNRHEYGLRNLIAPTGSDVGAGYDTANFNRDFHFAFTWNEANGQIRIYENGELALSTSVNSTLDRFSTIDDVNVWLGRSNWTGDENAQGEYDEFRIYNRVLPPEQVRSSYTAGPDQLATADPVSFVAHPQTQSVPELGNVVFTALAQGAPPITLQWYKNNSPLNGQTNNSLNLTSVPLSDNNAQFYVIGSNNISGSSFTATSQVAVLTVNADTVAPTLTQIRVDGRGTLELLLSEPIRPADAANPGNFILTGPPGSPTILTSSASGDGRRVLLNLSGPLQCDAYTITVNGVHDRSDAGNVIATDSTIVFWNYAPPTLSHRYTFNNAAAADATGGTVQDAIGTADGTVRSGGRPTSFTGDRVTLSGGVSSTSPYVDLPNNLLSNNSTNRGGTGKLSFEGWVKVTGNHSWSRIIDMGSSGACCAPGSEIFGPGGGGEGIDYFFYSAQIGTDVNRRRVDVTNRDTGGAAGVEYSEGNFNRDFHFVITWDEQTKEVNTYEDGALVGSFTSQNAMSDINDVNVWLGRSTWTVDENMQGEFDEFRIYNQVLSPSTIALNRLGGPDNNFGAPTSLTLVVTNHVMITNTVQRTRALVVFSNISTQDVAASGCAMFESSDPGVVRVSADGVLEGLVDGTSTITVRFAGHEDSVLVEVTTDVTGPHLVRARPFGLNIIELAFSEPVLFAEATDQGNYSVSGPGGVLGVSAVTQSPDGAKVFITLSDPLRCEYTTVTVKDVRDVSPNNNVLDPNPSSISFMNYVPRGLKHRYTFNNGTGNAASGSVIPDAVGAANGVVLGGPASFTGDRLVMNGGSSASAAYVDLPNGLLSVNGVANGGSGEITVEGWVKITGIHTWSRIFDFGSSLGAEVPGPGGGGEGTDYFMLSAMNANDPNVRRIEVRNVDPPGGGINTVDQATAGLNQETHFAVTWDEKTGQIRAYENGAQVAGMSLPTKISDINDVNVWLGRSNWTGDENTQGEFEDFRIYNRVLSLQEVQASEAIGPDNSLGEPRAIRISMPSPVTLGQWITPTVTGDFASVSNVDLSGTACFTLESSDSGVIAVGFEGTVNAVGAGSATVTARLSGFSDSAPVTVILPPTIVRQPCANSVCLSVPAVTPPPAGGSVVSSQDFNSSDGGCTVINVNAPFEGPWTYNSAAGTWSSAGQDGELNRAPSTRLTCPAVTLTQAGNVRISFSHRYSFEDGGGYWDGGALQVSVNGGAFVTVPALAFVQNGYNGTVVGNSASELRGQGSFVSTSAGYGTPTFITSIADIGCLSAGDTVSVRWLAAFDTNTRNGNPAWEIDSVSVIEGAGNGTAVELGVWASPGNPGDSVSVQWQKSTGGPFADIAGANNGLLAFLPLLADNGSCYRAVVTGSSGGSVTSAVACLTVIQPNTPPSFTCGPNVTVSEDPGPQSSTWATGIVPHSFAPAVPVAYSSDFSSLPPGSQVFGNAVVSGGILHLTDAANDRSGAWLSSVSAAKIASYHISFKALVGGGTCCGDPTTGNPAATADGFSVNVATNLPNGTYANPAEEGQGSGLSICFDTWDNGNSEAPAIDVKFGGITVASVHTQVAQSPDSAQDVFKNVSIDVSATGVLNVTYDGTNVFTNLQLPNYVPQADLKFGMGARTGGANQNHWIDDLSLTAIPADDSLSEVNQTVSFLVNNDNPSLFSVQPAVSPNGTLSYTPAPNACGAANVTLVAKDNGGTNALCGGSDTSAPCTFTINVNCVNDCPTANSQSISAQPGVPTPITLTGSDPDGDALTAAVASNPAHGTLSIISGVLNYKANAGYSGPDSFTFTVNDGACTSAPATVSINVTNHCPTATPQTVSAQSGVPQAITLTGSDADGETVAPAVASNPAHGILQNGFGVIYYTANAGYTGPDSFTFTVSDGKCTSAPATVSINVTAPNTPPTARIVGSPLANFFPYLPNLVLIAANGSNACVTLDGSTSSDPETPANALSYAWSLQGSPTNFATGVRATNCVELGTYTYNLAVTDPQGATGTDTLTIDVLTPCEAEGAIIIIIQNSALPRNTKKSLVASVKAACSSYEKDGANSGANQLQAFQNKVRTHVRPIDLVLAYQLEAAAQVIIDALEGL